MESNSFSNYTYFVVKLSIKTSFIEDDYTPIIDFDATLSLFR